MNTSAILQDSQLVSKLAAAISDNEFGAIREGDAIMIKSNSGEFAVIAEDRINARSHQGWVECVSATTLDELNLIGDTTATGIPEAEAVAKWMKAEK